VSEAGDLLRLAAELGAGFRDSLAARPVQPTASAEELRSALGGPLPAEPDDPAAVTRALAAASDPGLMATAGGRFFGFVIGGTLPAALAADVLTTAWDQNAGLYVAAPAASVAEEVAGAWLLELLGLPRTASFGFVTSGQMANFTALAAARHHVLRACGWDVEREGLAGAPRVRVVVGEKRHGTIDRALRMLGLGVPTDVVPADSEGRLVTSQLRLGDEPTIVCAQAGEVNTGAFDDFPALADARDGAANAWLHVDGAFGLWGAVSPRLQPLVAGVERADSWATDLHKWLNVPYDCGVAITAHPESHSAAFSARAPYLVFDPTKREAMDWNPEHSRRARSVPVYAAIRSLGRSGIRELVERCCDHAGAFAAGLEQLGAEVLNDVVLNQVLFRFGSDEQTQRFVQRVQDGGEAWIGGTTWNGRFAVRLSVSSWETTDADVERSLAAFATALA
jgi:glutamate/tyrosine decarboxylase-like PLP-dependent enzyme